MNFRIGVVVLVPALSLIVGCTQGLDRNSQTRVFALAAADEVFDAAIVVLRSEFSRLNIDRELRRIESAPVEFRTAADSGTARGLVGVQLSMRRVAHFRVGRRGDGAVAHLRIDVERQDTDHRRVQQYQGTRLSDTPGGHTPIERDAATTRSQNTVWARVRRDRTLERALLDELQERVGPPPANPPDGPMPSSKSAEG